MAYHCLPIELYTSILDRCTFFIPALIIFRSNSNLVIGIVCQLLLFFFVIDYNFNLKTPSPPMVKKYTLGSIMEALSVCG